MPDNDRNTDPTNPEQKAIQDAMKRDGEFLRDVREGKTPTEQAFGIDLGATAPQVEEHNALFRELGSIGGNDPQEAASDPAAPVAPPVEAADIPEPPEIAPPEVSEPAPPGPVAELAAAHDDLMREMAAIPVPERKKAERREEMARRRVEHRMRSEHNQAFVELGQVPHPEAPPEKDEPLTPADMARIAHPGREKPHDFGEAFAAFAHEDKEWRAEAVELFRLMADFIQQSRLELDGIRGLLERSR